jgi:hypothetical protein
VPESGATSNLGQAEAGLHNSGQTDLQALPFLPRMRIVGSAPREVVRFLRSPGKTPDGLPFPRRVSLLFYWSLPEATSRSSVETDAIPGTRWVLREVFAGSTRVLGSRHSALPGSPRSGYAPLIPSAPAGSIVSACRDGVSVGGRRHSPSSDSSLSRVAPHSRGPSRSHESAPRSLRAS